MEVSQASYGKVTDNSLQPAVMCHPYVADITVEKPFLTVDAFSSYPLPLQCGKYLAINKSSFYFQVKSFAHRLLKLYFYKCNVCKSFHP